MTFIPQFEKEFPYQEGDLLMFFNKKTKSFYITKILKIERAIMKKGDVRNIAGQQIEAPEDDFFLIVAVKWSDYYNSTEKAKEAVEKRKLTWKVQHIPMRPGCFIKDPKELVGHQEVSVEELESYNEWRQIFDKGDAGVW